MNDTAALAEIRRAAQTALDAWPEARAAVLFGSRARGNHHQDSDWDIAFIVGGDGERPRRIPSGVPFHIPGVRCRHHVNGIAIPERLVVRKALCIGHIGRGIVRDGTLLAGEWSRPTLEGEPFMETDRYWKSMNASLRMVEGAIEASAKLGRSENWREHLGRADDFVACTADAAEHLAKAIMGRHGLDAYRSHLVEDLAHQARTAGHEGLAKDFTRMDGATRDDHKARYEGADRDSLAHAILRLPAVIDIMRKELADLPESFLVPQERAELADAAIDILSHGAIALRSATKRDGQHVRLPPLYAWLKPMINLRKTLPPALDRTVEAIRNAEKGSGGKSG